MPLSGQRRDSRSQSPAEKDLADNERVRSLRRRLVQLFELLGDLLFADFRKSDRPEGEL